MGQRQVRSDSAIGHRWFGGSWPSGYEKGCAWGTDTALCDGVRGGRTDGVGCRTSDNEPFLRSLGAGFCPCKPKPKASAAARDVVLGYGLWALAVLLQAGWVLLTRQPRQREQLRPRQREPRRQVPRWRGQQQVLQRVALRRVPRQVLRLLSPRPWVRASRSLRP